MQFRLRTLLILIAVVAGAIEIWESLPNPKPLYLAVVVPSLLPPCLFLAAYTIATRAMHPDRKTIGAVIPIASIPLLFIVVLLYASLILIAIF